jgi:hypothetical protein
VSTGETTKIDVRERGADGQMSDRRLFMQLSVFGDCLDAKPLVRALESSRIEGALYQDVNDARGVGVLAMSEDPLFFVTGLREVLTADAFAGLAQKHALTMFGRTYAAGFETDLDDWLLRRPRRAALNPAWPWAIWYPLRRTGAYGDADLAHDVRLACHGLDVHDNDFVIGLVGRELHPLSHLVQAMRKTVQTSQYIQALGPFFVGHALWQSPFGKTG